MTLFDLIALLWLLAQGWLDDAWAVVHLADGALDLVWVSSWWLA